MMFMMLLNGRTSHRANGSGKEILLKLLCSLALLVLLPSTLQAGGISVDAGLTPAEDRWIFRSQFRQMRFKDSSGEGRKMIGYGVPLVLAYGLYPQLSVLIKQTMTYREMRRGGKTSTDSGWSDFLVLTKYKLYRLNTRDYTFGLAGTVGMEFPTGKESFSSGTWDIKPGVYASLRSGPTALDFTAEYAWNGFADQGTNDIDPGNELFLNWAGSYQFLVGGNANTTLAPVLELSYINTMPDRRFGNDIANTGESVLYLSPGTKFTVSSLIFEALAQFPVLQHQMGIQLEREFNLLLGIRYMF